MLRGSLAFLVLVGFAVASAEIRGYFAAKGLRAPAMENVSFLVVGFALGERGLGLFPAGILETLRPVVLLGLAWIGLVFGLQVDGSVIRRLRPWHRSAGLVIPFLIGCGTLVAAVLLRVDPVVALALAAVAAASSPSTMDLLARTRPAADPSALRLLRLTVAFAGIPAMFVFHAGTVMWSPLSTWGVGGVPAWQLLLVQFAIGAVFGYGVLFLIRGITDSMPMLTLMIGAMAVAAGVASLLGLSCLVPAAVAGAVVVNRSIFPNRVLKVAHSMERPLFIALLVLVGASWAGTSFSWVVFFLMVPVRLVLVFGGGLILRWFARANATVVELTSVGLGLVPQGELALGLVVASLTTIGGEAGAFEAVLAAIVVNQTIGQLWLRGVLFRASRGDSCPA